ncbi:MAG: hypothetical protein RL708_354 [Bacteroidota bacterium]|jgi:RNA polymerase sigma factor (sigma-70 family)
MNLAEYNQKSLLPDADLIKGLLEEHDDYLQVIYKKHKSYAIKFMQKQANNQNYDEEFNDIYHDAVLVLYEKVKGGNFTLTSTIQTYLNSICRNQLLVRFKKNSRFTIISDNNSDEYDDDGEGLENLQWDEKISDWLPQDENDINGERVQAMVKSLELMKAAKGHCYELLSMFFYHNKTMDSIAQHFGYTNADNAKNQKYRCQEKLKSLTFENMRKVK